MMIALFDIDGCCADSSERHKHLKTDEDLYFSLHHTDKPIEQGVLIYGLLMDVPKLRKVFITGRGAEQRETTELLLAEMFPDCEYELLMRPTGDRRPAEIVKRELMELNDIDPEDVLIAFDDDADVIAMYRSLGITAYQTADQGY